VYCKTRSRATERCWSPRSLTGAMLLAACMLPGLALAHSEVATRWHLHAWGIEAGWMHPFTGIDHLLAMLALGLWAGQRGGRGLWVLPVAFLVCLLAGGLLAMAGTRIPAVEPMILLSLLAMGGLIATSMRVADSFALVAAGVVGLFHGLAHGGEMPLNVSPQAYAAGFVVASATLHVAGMMLVWGLRRAGAANLTRMTGAGIAATGLLLLIG